MLSRKPRSHQKSPILQHRLAGALVQKKNSIFNLKRPIFNRKSRIFHLKSPVSHQKSPILHKSRCIDYQKSPILQRTLVEAQTIKKSTPTNAPKMHMQKSPGSCQKSPRINPRLQQTNPILRCRLEGELEATGLLVCKKALRLFFRCEAKSLKAFVSL